LAVGLIGRWAIDLFSSKGMDVTALINVYWQRSR